MYSVMCAKLSKCSSIGADRKTLPYAMDKAGSVYRVETVNWFSHPFVVSLIYIRLYIRSIIQFFTNKTWKPVYSIIWLSIYCIFNFPITIYAVVIDYIGNQPFKKEIKKDKKSLKKIINVRIKKESKIERKNRRNE